MDNVNDVNDIDVSEINWNKLTPSEFMALEKRQQKILQITKEQNKLKRKKRTTELKTINLRGRMYVVKDSIYQRLKTLRSDKSKESLINEIIETHTPIPEI